MERTITSRLALQRQSHLYRSRRIRQSSQDTTVTIAGKSYVSFCSNDYLGLANHPALIRALHLGAEQYGVGSGASHLVSGHCAVHHELEEALAAFTQRSKALLFSSGYMANLGVISALASPGDHIYEDRLNHASLIDAGLLSRARLHRYPHGDMAALKRKLGKSSQPQQLIISDGVFSMDGDIAPVPELSMLAKSKDALLMVDDAHGLGVIGPEGRGTLGYYDLGESDVPVLMGTLGKAFGTFGAFVAGSVELIEYLIQFARTYIYTTALPPAIAQASLAALSLIQGESERRDRLQSLCRRFIHGARQLGLPLGGHLADRGNDPITPIIPLILGDNRRTLTISDALNEKGLLITAIRPPTVPVGTARLRITLCANHTEAQVDHLLETLSSLL